MGLVTSVVFPSGESGWLSYSRGRVHDIKVWSETDVSVSSSGGGGYIHPQYGGTIQAPTIRSSTTTTEKKSFWIKDDQGVDKSFNIDIAVADGHDVVIVWGGVNEKESGPFLCAKNITTGQEKCMHPSLPLMKYGKVGFLGAIGFQDPTIVNDNDILISRNELSLMVAKVRDKVLFGFLKKYGLKSILIYNSIFLGACLLLTTMLFGFGNGVMITEVIGMVAIILNMMIPVSKRTASKIVTPILRLRQQRIEDLNKMLKLFLINNNF